MRVGDVIYLVNQGKDGEEIFEEEIIGAALMNDGRIIYETHSISFDRSAIGTSVFTSRQAAHEYYVEHYGETDDE